MSAPTLRARLANLTDGLEPGPFHPVYTYAVGGGRVFDSLENAAGDSSFPDGEDIAAFINAMPALLDVADWAHLVVSDFLTRPASLAAHHVQSLDGLRDALIALGLWTSPDHLGQQIVHRTALGRRVTGDRP